MDVKYLGLGLVMDKGVTWEALGFEAKSIVLGSHHGDGSGSTVWWLRVRYMVGRLELGGLQRLVCLALTGVTKMSPTAAMEVLLQLLPFQVMTEAEDHTGV
jgi:hypothetical protein